MPWQELTSKLPQEVSIQMEYASKAGPGPLVNQQREICGLLLLLLMLFIICFSDDRNGDASLVVSLEINGISYQGVLFAQAADQAASKAIRSS